ncbi:uncharacterized protein LOC116656661 isoform X1 [Camelus ferus]|uniref:Uncharacterized protein LOC116656661 isoform X1 n=1 Tax=Camelus ferus TaxID=419612 RepID=A0A8B8TPF7_CAMFR|nr:uncharacterized protein LOC116656661 isoform X1 [Camelus ferus]
MSEWGNYRGFGVVFGLGFFFFFPHLFIIVDGRRHMPGFVFVCPDSSRRMFPVETPSSPVGLATPPSRLGEGLGARPAQGLPGDVVPPSGLGASLRPGIGCWAFWVRRAVGPRWFRETAAREGPVAACMPKTPRPVEVSPPVSLAKGGGNSQGSPDRAKGIRVDLQRLGVRISGM